MRPSSDICSEGPCVACSKLNFKGTHTVQTLDRIDGAWVLCNKVRNYPFSNSVFCSCSLERLPTLTLSHINEFIAIKSWIPEVSRDDAKILNFFWEWASSEFQHELEQVSCARGCGRLCKYGANKGSTICKLCTWPALLSSKSMRCDRFCEAKLAATVCQSGRAGFFLHRFLCEESSASEWHLSS